MRYAIIADIHANLDALAAVMEDAQSQRVTHFACLGDLVGYYREPKECVDLIRAMGIPCVKGNWDEWCSSEVDWSGFNPAASAQVHWTREQLTATDRDWLRGLPLYLRVAGFSIVHATLDGPEHWEYVFDKFAAASSFSYQDTAVCFFGHTHVPTAFMRDSQVRGGTYSKFEVEPGRKYFVNPGSVGQPRDRIPRPSYAIYDLEEQTIEYRRPDYEMSSGRDPTAA